MLLKHLLILLILISTTLYGRSAVRIQYEYQKAFPETDTVLFTQAQLYYSTNNFDSAALLAQMAVNLRPDQISYIELLASSDYRLEKADTAMQLCEQILTLDPSDANALLLSGIILGDIKKDSAALEKFNRCLKADPANIDALTHRADVYVRMKKYNDALRDYSAARADLSDNADILNNIGICYYRSGAYPRALSFFKKALTIDHLNPQSYFNEGLSYYHMNELDTATIYLKTAGAIWDTCSTDSSHAYFLDAMYYLGMCYKRSGDLPAARSQFEMLQREGYPRDLTYEIKMIDCALFISRNWYYFVLLFLFTIGLTIALVKLMRRT